MIKLYNFARVTVVLCLLCVCRVESAVLDEIGKLKDGKVEEVT